MNHGDGFYIALGCVGIILLAVAFSALEAWVFMLLWNWIAVFYFTAPTLTFLPAWGILILLNLIGSAFRSRTTVDKN